MALSSIDQQVWRKALAAKNQVRPFGQLEHTELTRQSMTEIQLATSLPALKPKEIQSALATLLKHVRPYFEQIIERSEAEDESSN